MDLSQSIAYNGITCAPLTPSGGGGALSGTVLTSIDYAQVPVAINVEKRALTDGSTLSDAYLSARPMILNGQCYGTSEGDLWDKVNSWMAAFSPRSPSLFGTAALTYIQPSAQTTTWPTGIPLYMNMAPTREPWHGAVSRVSSATGAHVLDVHAQLMAADPYQYINQAAQTAIIICSLTASAITYRGNAPAMSSIHAQVLLSATGPKIQLNLYGAGGATNSVGYSSVTADLSGLSTGVIYDIDLSRHYVTQAGVIVSGVLAAGNVYGAVTPGVTAAWQALTGAAANVTYVKLIYPETFF